MIRKNADTQVVINELLSSRWSGRAFDSNRGISRTDLVSLLEAARWSPSCYGDQPWRFIIFNRLSRPEPWESAITCLSEGNQSWAKNAPVLILSMADTLLSVNDKPNRWGAFDTGAACMSMCIQATELGLMVHQMGGFDSDKARHVFLIPERYIPMSMMAIGYQLPPDKLPEEIKQRELAARIRRPLTDNFFENQWGECFNT